MASSESGTRAGRLDASEQEVVFCHLCAHEWPRSERESLQCPRCNGEATEIIEPQSDPRDGPDYPFPPSFASFRHRFPTHHHAHDTDSDPEEGDIDDHVNAGTGTPFMRRSIFGAPPRPDRRPPTGADDIIMRFTDMLYQMSAGARPTPPGGLDDDPLPPPRPDAQPERETNDHGFSQPRIHRTTFRSGPFGGNITITSSTFSGGTNAGPSDFDRIFTGIMGAGPARTPSPGERHNQGPGQGMAMGPMGLAALLQEIIGATINPASAVHGDAVYSQEALDRIVSTLMEAHPQSNAAPPATQTAIDQLEKKKLTDEMIGSEGKAECTICIDEMHRGDDVTILPCTHWFHGECVTLWLKEHNTCPICRRAIETTAERRERRMTGSSPNTNPQSPGERESAAGPSATESSQSDQATGERRYRSRWDMGPSPSRGGYFPPSSNPSASEDQIGQEGSSFSRSFFFLGTNPGHGDPSSSSNRQDMPGQYPSLSELRDRQRDMHMPGQYPSLNELRDRQRDTNMPGYSSIGDRYRDRDQASTSSRRRPLSIFGDSSSRRENSSQSQNGGNGSNSGTGSSSHNPLNWVRNHFGSGRNSGGSGSGGNSSEDRDRERRWRS